MIAASHWTSQKAHRWQFGETDWKPTAEIDISDAGTEDFRLVFQFGALKEGRHHVLAMVQICGDVRVFASSFSGGFWESRAFLLSEEFRTLWVLEVWVCYPHLALEWADLQLPSRTAFSFLIS